MSAQPLPALRGTIEEWSPDKLILYHKSSPFPHTLLSVADLKTVSYEKSEQGRVYSMLASEMAIGFHTTDRPTEALLDAVPIHMSSFVQGVSQAFRRTLNRSMDVGSIVPEFEHIIIGESRFTVTSASITRNIQHIEGLVGWPYALEGRRRVTIECVVPPEQGGTFDHSLIAQYVFYRGSQYIVTDIDRRHYDGGHIVAVLTLS